MEWLEMKLLSELLPCFGCQKLCRSSTGEDQSFDATRSLIRQPSFASRRRYRRKQRVEWKPSLGSISEDTPVDIKTTTKNSGVNGDARKIRKKSNGGWSCFQGREHYSRRRDVFEFGFPAISPHPFMF